jgi:hypothetical protein
MSVNADDGAELFSADFRRAFPGMHSQQFEAISAELPDNPLRVFRHCVGRTQPVEAARS